MRKPSKPPESESEWKKIGPCLYRYATNGVYYGLAKRKGKQNRQSLRTTDLNLARRRLREFLDGLETKNPDLGRITLEDFRPRYYETLSGEDSTIYKHKLAIDTMIANWPAQSPRVLDRIRLPDCEAWLATMNHLAPSTLNDRITSVTRFFQSAVEAGAIVRNPMSGIKYRRRQRPIRATPTEEEFRAIVANLRAQKSNGHGADETGDYVELAGMLGLGQAELAGIRRQDIDLKAGIIRVFRRKTKQQFTIPIFPEARPIVERRLKELPEDPDARLLAHNNCRKALEGACDRLKLPKFEPRSLRRFHITRCLRKGIDAPTVAQWQGHQDGGALVLKTYQAELGLDHSLKMAALLDPSLQKASLS
jgi:integrase